jgi:hypothetical protein
MNHSKNVSEFNLPLYLGEHRVAVYHTKNNIHKIEFYTSSGKYLLFSVFDIHTHLINEKTLIYIQGWITNLELNGKKNEDND